MNANSDERDVYDHPDSLLEYYKTKALLPLEEEELLDFSYPTSTVRTIIHQGKILSPDYFINRIALYLNMRHARGLSLGSPQDTLAQFFRDIIVIYFNRSLYDIDAYIEFYELLILLHNNYAPPQTELHNNDAPAQTELHNNDAPARTELYKKYAPALTELIKQYSHVTGEDFDIEMFKKFIDNAKKQKTAMLNNSKDDSNANVGEEEKGVTDSDTSDDEDDVLLRKTRNATQAQVQPQAKALNNLRQSRVGGARRRKPRK
jgi:hypothetical protein